MNDLNEPGWEECRCNRCGKVDYEREMTCVFPELHVCDDCLTAEEKENL